MKKNRKLIEQAKNLSSSDLYHIIQSSNNPLSNKYQIEFYHAIHLSNEYKKQIVDLFENNMKDFYEQSNDGYNSIDKRNELFSNQSRYLIILVENVIIAFVHFRFDMDYGNRVLYLYELQINMKYQGQGLGKWIIEQLKLICQKTQMMKIVLTVHKINQKAIDFYMKKCLFQLDFTNPNDEDVDYFILSFTV